MDAAVAALVGAAIGAIGSVGGVWLQQRHQTRRDRLKIAADLGLADHNSAVELAKLNHGGGYIAPVSAYVMYHVRILDVLAEGDVTPKHIQDIAEKQSEILKAMPRPKEGR
ncbi:MAG: hypothetical protein KF738_14235 [Burkholderiales bacterium]|nr:hypothetical protein [Burkholderiales bacterium]